MKKLSNQETIKIQNKKINELEDILKSQFSFLYALAVELHVTQIDLGKEPSPELEKIITTCGS